MVDPVRSPRVIFVGDTNVGKTSLIHRARYGQFNDSSIPTVAAGLTEMDADHNGVRIAYQLVDTAGQECYRSVVPIYFRDCCGAVIVFSLLDLSSFTNLQFWIDEILKFAKPDLPLVIVGNKVDRPQHDWVVTQQNALGWANERKLTLIFTSALSGDQVPLLIGHIVDTFVVPSLGGFPGEYLPAVQTRQCC